MQFTIASVIFTALFVNSNAFREGLKSRLITRPILTEKENLTKAELKEFLPFSMPEKGDKLVNTLTNKGLKNGEGYLSINKHIVGGTVASRGQFPYQAALVMDSDWFCGGSLITHTHILTAAHCSEGASTFSVTLGAQDRDATEDGRIVQESKRAAIHRSWDSEAVKNDISIIYLTTPVQISNYIKLVRLPRRSFARHGYVGYGATVSGWGRLSDANENVSTILNTLKMEVVSLLNCVNLYGKGSVTTGNLCVKGKDKKGTCNGDSGGPLVVRESDGTITQVGIVSYGAAEGCGAGYPDVFTRVAAYFKWITLRTNVVLRH